MNTQQESRIKEASALKTIAASRNKLFPDETPPKLREFYGWQINIIGKRGRTFYARRQLPPI
jgi:hypothetical protein